ncbi:MAG: radical SAM protein [Chromatiales bacterium]|nr:radical SAM protein [Chromatiales bacterium]
MGTSRGCPYSCRLCADATYYGRRLRMKSPERIVAELTAARDRHHVFDFLFWSESFTLRREWTQEVLEAIIAADLGIRFVCNSRSDHVDPDLLELLRRAGCWMIGFGLESGNQTILDIMGKNVTLEQNRQAVLWAKEAGLQITAHMVLGYPGETAETIANTIRFTRSLPLDYAQFYCAVPFPGSRMFQLCLDQELFIDEPWERFEQNFSIINTPELSAGEVMAWRSVAYRSVLPAARAHLAGFTPRGRTARDCRALRMMWDFREWA